jgi:cyclic pyranopterin phosphate synthase
MPRECFKSDSLFLRKEELLTFGEIERLARIFTSIGVRKIRLTGGEPFVRQKIEDLLQSLSTIPGIELTMTTNGILLPMKAQKLKASGLDRVTISLDSDDEDTFQFMNGAGYSVNAVLDGIEAADKVGLTPIKINMVVKRGVNEDSIMSMVRRFRGTGNILRFIEFMDVGTTNEWKPEDVVPAAEIVKRINDVFPLESLEPNYPGEVARRWQYKDGSGEIGIIASVTQPFCGDCSRARLSADGKLFTCLFATEGDDLRQFVRNGASDQEIAERVGDIWSRRIDRYSEIRNLGVHGLKRIEMSYIGG